MQGTADTRILNLTSNVAALLVFLFSAKIHFPLGLPMALGQIAGTRLGVCSAPAQL